MKSDLDEIDCRKKKIESKKNLLFTPLRDK